MKKRSNLYYKQLKSVRFSFFVNTSVFIKLSFLVVPNRDKKVPNITTDVYNITHSTAILQWNISSGDEYLPIQSEIWIQYQPIGDIWASETLYVQRALNSCLLISN